MNREVLEADLRRGSGDRASEQATLVGGYDLVGEKDKGLMDSKAYKMEAV